MRARAYTGAVLAAAFLVPLVVFPPAVHAEPRITVEIVTVIASKGERGFGPGLANYKREFRSLPFNRYELVKAESRELGTGDEAKISLPGNAYLQITMTGATGAHSGMHVLMNHNNLPIFNTNIRLDNESGVVFGGPKVERGTVIVNIRAVKRAATAAAPGPEPSAIQPAAAER